VGADSNPEEDEMETKAENACFGGTQGVYTHASEACGVDMTFGLFLPEAAKAGPVPVLWFLSGLTCTHENAMTKSMAQAHAAAEGIAVVFPDTSPRGEGVADDENFDMGQGAGFYVNATEDPWAKNFRMWDYVTEELPKLVADNFAADPDRQAITGHSMGGHGALTIAMNLPERFASVSAFSPMCNTMDSDWGTPQLTKYLGEDRANWEAHDASHLMRERGFPGPVLVDIGTHDQFWEKLKPGALAAAIAERKQHAAFRLQPGYDHSYFFVSSFVEDHVRFHGEALYG
jgi:S-formylglutathione hydrolase